MRAPNSAPTTREVAFPPLVDGHEHLLSAEAIDFLSLLDANFTPAIDDGLAARRTRQLCPEKHFTLDGRAVAGALFDAGLFLSHNAFELLARDSGPDLYLPKLESHREANDGHDATWVAHPGLVPVAMEVFDRSMPAANQVDRRCDEHELIRGDLLQVPDGTITEAGLRDNISAAVRYIGAWLAGRGCVPIRGKMEDAATAEIARAQLWQWIHHDTGKLDDGRPVTVDLVREALADERLALRRELDEAEYVRGHWDAASVRVDELVRERELADFLTTTAYERL